MRDPLRHHHAHRAGGTFGTSLAERTAEKVADGLGTTRFVIASTAIIVAWITVNALAALHVIRFDPYPFILLNLAFSAQAFYTGALVIIAQKAQSKKDRASEEASATHRQEEFDRLASLLNANTALTAEVHGLAEKLAALTEQVHDQVCRPPSQGAT